MALTADADTVRVNSAFAKPLEPPSRLFHWGLAPPHLHPFPTRRSSDLGPVLRDVNEKDLDRSARPRPGGPIDRKSTRLNSSHANTSYAVFCLKKKNGSTVVDIPSARGAHVINAVLDDVPFIVGFVSCSV